MFNGSASFSRQSEQWQSCSGGWLCSLLLAPEAISSIFQLSRIGVGRGRLAERGIRRYFLCRKTIIQCSASIPQSLLACFLTLDKTSRLERAGCDGSDVKGIKIVLFWPCEWDYEIVFWQLNQDGIFVTFRHYKHYCHSDETQHSKWGVSQR